MYTSRHREFPFSVGEHEQRLVFLYVESFSSASELFSRIGELDITLAGAKWNCIFAPNSTSARCFVVGKL